MLRRYRAAWVFPVESPPLADGVVAVEGGRIVAVGPAKQLGFDEELGDAALLPGLVNAHVHLDLTNLRGKLPPPGADPTVWLEQVIGHRRAEPEAETEAAVRAGIEECLRSGATCVGDIDGSGVSSRLTPTSPLRGIVFRELIGLTEAGMARSQQLVGSPTRERGTNPVEAGPNTPGLSPHAPYSVRRELLAWTAGQGLPLAMHLGEFREEAELMTQQSGPFRSFLERLGVWDGAGLLSGWPEALRLLGSAPRALLAHGNHFPPDLFPLLRPFAVVYCPRTHAAFGHPPHPFKAMLAAGVNVALGTDGLASNPDLSLFREMQFLWRKHADEVKGETLLAMGTDNGAQALGLGEEVGALAVGKRADLIALALETTAGADAHRLLLESWGLVQLSLIGGVAVVRAGALSPPGS